MPFETKSHEPVMEANSGMNRSFLNPLLEQGNFNPIVIFSLFDHMVMQESLMGSLSVWVLQVMGLVMRQGK
jgi:hypothetical protein